MLLLLFLLCLQCQWCEFFTWYVCWVFSFVCSRYLVFKARNLCVYFWVILINVKFFHLIELLAINSLQAVLTFAVCKTKCSLLYTFVEMHELLITFKNHTFVNVSWFMYLLNVLGVKGIWETSNCCYNRLWETFRDTIIKLNFIILVLAEGLSDLRSTAVSSGSS